MTRHLIGINPVLRGDLKLWSSNFQPQQENSNMKMKASCLSAVFLAAALAAPTAMAQDGAWMVRVRALNMKLDNGNSPEAPGAKVTVNDKTFPEIDFVYQISKNVSAELVLTYPQKHDVSLQGAKIGTLKHLPPTLLAQYQFAPGQSINPYVGAGINYTRFMDVSLPSGITTDKDSVGFALQVGVDVEIGKNMYLNLDYKKVNIETDVKVAGAKLTTFKVDPDLISIGIGWRF